MVVITACATQVQKGHTSTTPERLTDFCDGAHYFTQPLFSEHPTALQIFLYYDDVEVCNPLGSSKGKHKLGNYKIHVLPIIVS